MAGALHISNMPDADHLTALEYGRVAEGQSDGVWRQIWDPDGPRERRPLVAYLHDATAGQEVGFLVLGASALDVDRPAWAELWKPPCFDVPLLGLAAASAGEIILAARARFGSYASLGHDLCLTSQDHEGERALHYARAALEAGEMSAHHWAGFALLELRRCREAYAHLRHYAELAPGLTCSWYWLGRCAEMLGDYDEAYAHYKRAAVSDGEDYELAQAREALSAIADLRRPDRSPLARLWPWRTR